MLLYALIGIFVGILWYTYGERFNKDTLGPKCWEILHYHNKEKYPLILVHLKSIFSGLVLIYLSTYSGPYKNNIIAIIGGAIIGLHILQWKDETLIINSKPIESDKPGR